MNLLRGVSAALAVVAFSVVAYGQGPIALIPRAPSMAPDPAPSARLRVDLNLVLVPVTVCDPMNRPVTGLEKESFRVFDDNAEQKITAFTQEDAPVAVGLVFDTSGSMGAKLRLSREAAAAFFQTANPEDEFFLVEFSDSPKLVVPITRNTQDIQDHLTFSQSKGRTALLDAVMLAMHELKKSKVERKALLVISDGGDNCSRYTETELKNLVKESDAIVYAIGIYGGASTPEEVAGPQLLTDIAEQSGGRQLPAQGADIPDIAAKIGVELRNRYILGYSPAAGHRDGRYHPVQVKIVPPRGLPTLKAFWRHGYYAPTE
ncbi:MAG TPA: VWA domain-containing protein [Bryobacteraceae bacterium]|nr:VWA domain-containing protein [Bryobacteraceae bacterium]